MLWVFPVLGSGYRCVFGHCWGWEPCVGLGELRGAGGCVLPTPHLLLRRPRCVSWPPRLRAESSIASNGINDYLLVLNAK